MLENKLNVAQLDTPIQKLENLSQDYGKNIYIKRDDFTGTELSGNKIRKLEYTIQYAFDHGYDTIITTGAVTSNHARATTALCAKENLECHLVLSGSQQLVEGNLFLDQLMGARIHSIESSDERDVTMETIASELQEEGKRPLIVPVGASDWIGTHGYMNAYKEILKQEHQLGIKFDVINVALGSGGTYAGLWYGNHHYQSNKQIVGYAVDADRETFTEKVKDLVKDLDKSVTDFKTIDINDCYVGQGYGQATDEELRFYIDIAQKEGLVLDPTYTGKAFRGMLTELENGTFDDAENILFIHTGGLQGYTQEVRERMLKLLDK